MAQVTAVEVRYLRRVQLREFEPGEAEISYTIQVDDGDDASQVGTKYMLECKSIVNHALIGKVVKEESSSVEDVSEQTEQSSKEKTKKTRIKKEAKVKKIPQESDIPEESDIPNDVEDDLPADEDSSKDDSENQLSSNDLQKKITAFRKKGVAVAKIKDAMAKFGASRTTEIPVENYEEFISILEQEVKKD